jgi:hypothetical protein
VTSSPLLDLLLEFTRDKLALRERHVAGAQHVSHYDFNNTYQYIINREDAQVAWLQSALAQWDAAPPAVSAPSLPGDARGRIAETEVIEDDRRQAQAFLEKWRPRLEGMAHARHRKMLDVILGETVEQVRFFDQMLRGRDDVLGRRTGGASTGGGVLPVRWLRQ